MTIRDTILQTVRAWFAVSIPLVDPASQIIPADDKGPRPSLPYLTVKVTAADVAVGVDEKKEGSSGGAPTVTPRGIRSGSVSVQGYGAITSEWIQDATLALTSSSVQAVLTAGGLTVTTLGSGTTDLSGLLDTKFEPRFLKEFQIGYAVLGNEETLVELLNAEMNLTLESEPDDPDPLIVDITILEP